VIETRQDVLHSQKIVFGRKGGRSGNSGCLYIFHRKSQRTG